MQTLLNYSHKRPIAKGSKLFAQATDPRNVSNLHVMAGLEQCINALTNGV